MIQIFVVEDELLIRQSIRQVIESMAGPYAFCGEAADGELALSMMQDIMPDIVITDIRMPFLDGFGLIRHVKTMMPWTKVIILSGYGDFEYAQKAIALGVDRYLLKPIRPAELTKVIEQTAQQLAEDRQKSTLPQGFDRDTVQQALHQQFMQQLLYGGLHTATLLERARALSLDIVRPHYQLVLFSFDQDDLDVPALQASVQHLMAQMDLALYTFNGINQMTVLCLEQDPGSLNEQVYQLINILRHEMKPLCPTITAVVSNVVSRMSMVCQAYRAAADLLRRVYGAAAGQVLDVNDTAQMTADMIEVGNPFGDSFQQKLQYADAQEVPALVAEVLDSPEGRAFNSMLMRYNAMVNLLKMTVQQIARSKPGVEARDIATSLSGKYDVLQASRSIDAFREAAVSLLQHAVELRQENLSGIRYSHVISKVEKYVAENFCDPNISLISVAKYVGLSSAHLSTVFSQTMGRSFINYLTALRIERAKELLTTTGMKLAAIAMDIGYNEPNYFSHVFRKTVGMTPKEYRARNTGEDQ